MSALSSLSPSDAVLAAGANGVVHVVFDPTVHVESYYSGVIYRVETTAVSMSAQSVLAVSTAAAAAAAAASLASASGSGISSVGGVNPAAVTTIIANSALSSAPPSGPGPFVRSGSVGGSGGAASSSATSASQAQLQGVGSSTISSAAAAASHPTLNAGGGIGFVECIAVGGRYDLLVRSVAYFTGGRSQRPAGAAGPAGNTALDEQELPSYAVGVSVALDKLGQAVLRRERAIESELLRRKAEREAMGVPSAVPSVVENSVFVCSVGQNMLGERMRIAGELWSVQVRAGYLPYEHASLAEQLEAAAAQYAQWIVLLKDKVYFSTGTVRVKNVDKKTEVQAKHTPASALVDLTDIC